MQQEQETLSNKSLEDQQQEQVTSASNDSQSQLEDPQYIHLFLLNEHRQLKETFVKAILEKLSEPSNHILIAEVDVAPNYDLYCEFTISSQYHFLSIASPFVRHPTTEPPENKFIVQFEAESCQYYSGSLAYPTILSFLRSFSLVILPISSLNRFASDSSSTPEPLPISYPQQILHRLLDTDTHFFNYNFRFFQYKDKKLNQLITVYYRKSNFVEVEYLNTSFILTIQELINSDFQICNVIPCLSLTR